MGAIALDVNLPGMNGFAFCKKVRTIYHTPIIFLSARTTDDDQILALSVGGDDYMIKPFSLAVLLARIRRAIQRNEPDTCGFDEGHLRVDDQTGRTYISGQEVHLPTMEDRLLRYLVRHAGRVVGKQELFDQVWGEPQASDGTLTVHIRRLRMHIGPDPEHPVYLKTVWGRGYLFEASS